MARMIPNNFQYSYTKFLSDRQNAQQANYFNPGYAISDETKVLEVPKILPTKTQKFRTSTEFEQYGSLNSGKIYQTAVNEPVSVVPTAEYTVIKFDHEMPSKSILRKRTEDMAKKTYILKQQPKRIGDVIQKIAALFSNNSDSDELIKLEDGTIPKNKRDISGKEGIGHIPLVLTPTIPYVPQSSIHTTGVIHPQLVLTLSMVEQQNGQRFKEESTKSIKPVSTKSSDVFHPKSKIIESPKELSYTSSSKLQSSHIPVTSYELNSVSKSNEEAIMHNLDDLISILSSSAEENKLSITPTPALSTEILNLSGDKVDSLVSEEFARSEILLTTSDFDNTKPSVVSDFDSSLKPKIPFLDASEDISKSNLTKSDSEDLLFINIVGRMVGNTINSTLNTENFNID
ncbi:uncharacterized protein CEXT_175971 [Caerostris extrusa]|uniref:Uncharacterized protein n=1 Tax=Caerostris extrusa TaxID=172846 RepID=A0AAV4NN28_CAEEX|nr:uncharacterized protein CEXT_175971 [Caerostris extrusa]